MQTYYDSDILSASNAVADIVGSDDPISMSFLIFSSDTSYKYHFFALFLRGKKYTAVNAYARVGGTPKVFIIAKGEEEYVQKAYLKKIGEKIKKGYEVVI